jgi:putative flippase GtrA
LILRTRFDTPTEVFERLRRVIDSQKLSYLLVGGVNTLFGYGVGVGIYMLLAENWHIFLIGVVSNVISISFSFVTYKLFVFKTRGNWFAEYLKAYLVYGGMAALGILFLWLFVDFLSIRIWLAQGMVILLTVVISYFGHKHFTFREMSRERIEEGD